MKACRIVFAAITVLLAGTGSGVAQNYYAGAYGGANFGHDADTTFSSVPGVTFAASTNVGYALGAFVGYDLGNGFRVEGELSYRRNGLDELSSGGSSTQMLGDVSTLALLANGIYGFGTAGSAWSPYVGAGLGVARFSFIDAAPVGSPPESNDDTVFAYQLIAGLGYGLSPTLSLFADYRLFGTSDPKFTQPSGTVVDTEYLSSAVLIGFSSSF